MPGTCSVHTALDMDEGLKYLSSLLRSAPDGVQPISARKRTGAVRRILATVTN
jgi:hypothetical protein